MEHPPDAHHPQVLNYRGKRPAIPSRTPMERRWLCARILFRMILVLLFYLIAFEAGPHEILFGKLTALTPDDFIPFIEQRGVPVVRAAKEYQRDHGALPTTFKDLLPTYLPDGPKGWFIDSGVFEIGGIYNHSVTYDFTPGRECWQVRGAFVNGPVSLPPVPLPPSTTPSTPIK